MSRLVVKVTPNARKSGVTGWEDDPVAGRVLRIRVAAPATEGKANREVTEFVARVLGLGKSRVRVERGETSRIKHLEVDLEAREVDEAIDRMLNGENQQ